MATHKTSFNVDNKKLWEDFKRYSKRQGRSATKQLEWMMREAVEQDKGDRGSEPSGSPPPKKASRPAPSPQAPDASFPFRSATTREKRTSIG